MKYAQGKSFSVPASAGKLETCVRDGHAMPDVKGRCLRCGCKVRFALVKEQGEVNILAGHGDEQRMAECLKVKS